MTLLLVSTELAAMSPRWAVGDKGVYARAGEDWNLVAEAGDRQPTCVLGEDDHPLVGTTEAHLLRLAGETLEPVRGFEQSPGRTKWYTPWGGPPDVRSMAADPDGGLYVNVHVGGVLRSLDDGATWEPTPLDIDVDVHHVIAHDGLVLAACGDGGLVVSRDRGDTWEAATEGLHGTYCRAVAVAGDTLLLTASTGPFTREGAVYRRALDDNGPFERCTDLVPFNIDTFQLAAAGDQAAFGTEDGKVYVSGDAGRTWTLEREGLPTIRCVAFA